jgi:hypothetical protein
VDVLVAVTAVLRTCTSDAGFILRGEHLASVEIHALEALLAREYHSQN